MSKSAVYAAEAFEKIKENIPANACGLISETVIDAGIGEEGGFSSAKLLLEGLIARRGFINYNKKELENVILPTVDVFLDDPVFTCEEGFAAKGGITGITDGSSYALGYTEDADAQAEGNLVKAAPQSLVSAVMSAGTILAPVIAAMIEAGIPKEKIIWAWSTCPVAMFSKDPEEAQAKKAEYLEKYGVLTVYVRGVEESLIRAALAAYKGGELRIQDTVTAMTYVK